MQETLRVNRDYKSFGWYAADDGSAAWYDTRRKVGLQTFVV
ncbi:MULTISPECIES: hypothetical protein [unclassified Imperialibacter]|nr:MULTISPECIES: hypothetical protein [unclassified Imperialibacter]